MYIYWLNFILGDFPLTVRDCVEGLKIAVDRGITDWSSFDSAAYEHVGVVVRLNQPAYDRRIFTDNGIEHFDIYFPDGGLPECTSDSLHS